MRRLDLLPLAPEMSRHEIGAALLSELRDLRSGVPVYRFGKYKCFLKPSARAAREVELRHALTRWQQSKPKET